MFSTWIRSLPMIALALVTSVSTAAASDDASSAFTLLIEDEVQHDHLCGGSMDGEDVIGIDIRVRPGESLDHFARWTDSTVETIADFNELEVTAPLYPGMGLMLPLDESQRATLEQARNADIEQRLARFIDQRGGLAAIAAHQVTTGETGWDIARKTAGVPVWVLAAFNTDKDLGRLAAGDILYLPVMGTTLGERFDAAAAEVTSGDDESSDWE